MKKYFILIFILNIVFGRELFAQVKNLPPVINVSSEEVQIIAGTECDDALIFDGVSFDDEGDYLEFPVTYSGNLDCNTPGSYTIYYDMVDIEGLSAEQKHKTIIVVGGNTQNPPEIVAESLVVETTSNTAVVTWQTTTPTTSIVQYDVHQRSLHGENSSLEYETDHSITITELVPCTTYFFFVTGEDASRSSYASDSRYFNTVGCIGDVTSSSVGDLVSPENINEFTFDDSRVSLVSQPGSVQRDSVFQVKQISVSSVDRVVGCPAGAKPVGENAYDIKLLENYDTVADLQTPVSVTIDYDQEDLGSVDEETMSLYHYTEGEGWVKLNSCSVNTDEKTLTCQLNSFSKFMIMGEEDCDDDLIKSKNGLHWKIIGKINDFFYFIDEKIKNFFWSKLETSRN